MGKYHIRRPFLSPWGPMPAEKSLRTPWRPLSLSGMPANSATAVAFVDGCPEDCLSPHDQDKDRWHTYAFVFGDPSNHDAVEKDIRQNVPNFSFSKWALGRHSRKKEEYRNSIKQYLIPALQRNLCTVAAWSFKESTVWALKNRLISEFSLHRSDYIELSGKKGRTFVRLKHWHHVSLLEREILLHFMIADCMATSYRQFAEGMRTYHNLECPGRWQMITDYLAGDDVADHPRGFILQRLLARRNPNGCEILYRAGDLSQGLIMADNIAGMLNGVLGDPESKSSEIVWDVLNEQAIIWQETRPCFNAHRFVRPQQKTAPSSG